LLPAIQKGKQGKGIAITQDISGTGMHIVDYDNAQKILWQPEVFGNLPHHDAGGIATDIFLEPAAPENAVKLNLDLDLACIYHIQAITFLGISNLFTPPV
jgi:hypothetical protein